MIILRLGSIDSSEPHTDDVRAVIGSPRHLPDNASRPSDLENDVVRAASIHNLDLSTPQSDIFFSSIQKIMSLLGDHNERTRAAALKIIVNVGADRRFDRISMIGMAMPLLGSSEGFFHDALLDIVNQLLQLSCVTLPLGVVGSRLSSLFPPRTNGFKAPLHAS
jgi:hypothetical protein